MLMTPEMFGGRTYDGVTVENVGEDEDRWISLGHVDPAAFAAAVKQDSAYLYAPDSYPAEHFDPKLVQHRHAVLVDPAEWTGEDEWLMRWGGVDADTPDAFPITMIEME